MKKFLYALTFAASVGTIGVVATNPNLVQQGASFIGVSSSGSAQSPSASDEDHLEKFLSQYPYANKEDSSSPKPAMTEALPSLAVKTPPLPVREEEKKASDVTSEPKKEAKQEPKPEPKKELEPKKESGLPPLPLIAPVVVNNTDKQPAPPTPAFEPPKAPPVSSPPPSVAAATHDPFSTNEISSTTPMAQEPEGMASTRNPDFDDTGFASTKGKSVYETGNLNTWSEPVPTPQNPVLQEPAPYDPVIHREPVAAPAAPPMIAQEPVEQNIPAPQPAPPPSDPFLAHQPQPMPAQNETAADPFPQTGPPPQTPPPAPVMQADPPRQQPPPMVAAIQPVLQAPQPEMQPPQQKISSQFQVNPSIVAEEVPCHGTEMVARVGTQIIMMCDILPQLRRAGIRVVQEQMKKMPPEERAKVPKEEIDAVIDAFVESQYPAFLQEQITVSLVYNDYIVAKSREERETFEKKFVEEFDQKEVPELIKEFGVRDLIELKKFLKDELGSSLDQERRIWIRSVIAQQWILFSVQGATGECTHDEMMEYYTANKAAFTSKTRAQWQELFVAFSNHKTEQDARMKIAWMGNQIAAGLPLDEIAKRNSDGFTADKGGLWDWTYRGSLASKDLEEAVFTLQIGVLSPQIIRTDKGFHLIRVVKREEAQTTPFIDAQVTIRERIKQQRRMKFQEEYFEELNRRYPTIVLKEKIDFDLNRRTANVFDGPR